MPNTRQLRLNGSDFVSNDNDPSPIGNENHGNACAGVIAATMNNNQGVAGIAPNCRIMPIRMLGSGVGPDDIADAIEFAVDNGADILSNSWGNGSSNPNDEPSIVTAIDYAINNNRVVIIAAGNNADHHNSDNGFVAFPANVNIPGVITVGASDRNDNQANYSPTSSLIDIVAPSNRSMPWQNIAGETYEMWSIDIPDSAGYNIWHGPLTPPTLGEVLPSAGTNHLAYTARFGGTSHSCPVVAGVAALMLSVNPNLTNMEVFDILMNTAEDVGGYAYTDGRCDEMGHGRVNAYCAVQNALTPLASVSGPSVVCSSGATFTVNNLPPVDSIIWEPGPNLTVYSGQYTDSPVIKATGNGSSWVSARLVSDCGSITVPQQEVWVGKLDETKIVCSRKGQAPGAWAQYHILCDEGTTIAVAGYDANGDGWNEGDASSLASQSVLEYDWVVPSGWSWSTTYSGDVDNEEIEISPGWGANPSPGDIVQIGIRVRNSCGWTDLEYNNWQVVSCGVGGFLLSFSPNPTTGETTLTIKPESEMLKSASVSEEEFDDNAQWDMEIYSPMQALKTKKTQLKGQSTTIQTAGWMEGVYTVRVKYKDQVLTGKLIVKR